MDKYQLWVLILLWVIIALQIYDIFVDKKIVSLHAASKTEW